MTRARRGRREGVDQADEQPGVTTLLADLVEQERDSRVAHIGGGGDLEAEAGGEHGLETHAGEGDRGDLLAGEASALLRGQIEVEPTGAEELVGDDLARTGRPLQLCVGIDDPSGRGGVQLDDAAVDCCGCGHVTHSNVTDSNVKWSEVTAKSSAPACGCRT
jgi:hypothetical protein